MVTILWTVSLSTCQKVRDCLHPWALKRGKYPGHTKAHIVGISNVVNKHNMRTRLFCYTVKSTSTLYFTPQLWKFQAINKHCLFNHTSLVSQAAFLNQGLVVRNANQAAKPLNKFWLMDWTNQKKTVLEYRIIKHKYMCI